MGSDQDWERDTGGAIGVWLVSRHMRKIERRFVEAASADLTQREKLLMALPTRPAGWTFNWLRWSGVVLTDRRLMIFQASQGGRVKRLLLEVPRSRVSVQRFRPSPFGGGSLTLRFDEAVGRSPLKLNFNAVCRQTAEALRDALTSPPGGLTV
jgi:hypothetical protein